MEETIVGIAFFIFSVLTLGGGLMVVLDRNLFHAALYLLVSLFGVAGLFVLLVAPFLAVIQVLVYMGAIAILIIFAIMLTRGMMKSQEPYNTQSIAAAVVAVVLFAVLVVTLTPLVDEAGLPDDVADLNIESADSAIAGERVPGTLPQEPVSGVVKKDADGVEYEYETVEEIGRTIASRDGFVLPFEVASLLLTAAMIGAIVVAREDEA